MTRHLVLALALVATLAAGAAFAEETAMHHAKGEFDVQVTPKELDGPAADPSFSRLALAKTLRGDLEGTGAGQMLAAGGPDSGAGAYVAIERITGKLDGKEGSFALMHNGTMDASGYHLDVTVVPGSGTGELQGISGTFTILIEGGKHSYDFAYQLP